MGEWRAEGRRGCFVLLVCFVLSSSDSSATSEGEAWRSKKVQGEPQTKDAPVSRGQGRCGAKCLTPPERGPGNTRVPARYSSVIHKRAHNPARASARPSAPAECALHKGPARTDTWQVGERAARRGSCHLEKPGSTKAHVKLGLSDSPIGSAPLFWCRRQLWPVYSKGLVRTPLEEFRGLASSSPSFPPLPLSSQSSFPFLSPPSSLPGNEFLPQTK